MKLFDVGLEDRSLFAEALESVDLWSDSTGVDSCACLQALLHCEDGLDAFKKTVMKLLASDHCVGKFVVPVEHSADEWDQSTSDGNVLVFAGVHSDLARSLQSQEGELLLLNWAVLLMGMESGDASLRKHVSSVMRNLPSLVQRALDALTERLPLEPSSGKRLGEGLLKEKADTEIRVMQREEFSLRELIQGIGYPQNEGEWTVVAMKMYQSMLIHLPVSVRHWFTDLKPPHLAESVKQYTTLCVSPCIIESEFQRISTRRVEQDIKISGRRPKREVVVTLEVEDHAAIELVVKIPDCIPLKPFSVDTTLKVMPALFGDSVFF